MPKYCLCGLRIASDFPLGGASLVEDEAGADAAGSHADIRIVAGSVPDRLEGARGTRFQVAPDGAVRFNIRDVGAFLVEGGRHVMVAAAPGVSEQKLALFLLGSVFGFLCHQRGLFPLHASTIEIGGRAFSFAGDSGAGKSTTAAALIELGHTLLSDDISVIDLSGAQPMILPANPTQKLWRDSLDALNLRAGPQIRSTLGRDKFERPVAQTTRPDARPLAAICHLEIARHPTDALLAPITGIQALQRVRRQIYRFEAAQEMGAEPRLFLQTAQVVSAVPQVALYRPNDLSQLRVFARNLSDALSRHP